MVTPMEHLFDQILANPLYIVIALVLLAVLIFSIIKKIIKLIIYIAIALLAYVAYIHYFGSDRNSIIEKTIQKGTEKVVEVKKSVEENKQIQAAKKKIEKELKK